MGDRIIVNDEGGIDISSTVARMFFPNDEGLANQYLLNVRLNSVNTINDGFLTLFTGVLAEELPSSERTKFVAQATKEVQAIADQMLIEGKVELSKIKSLNAPFSHLVERNIQHGSFAGETLLALLSLNAAELEYGLLRAMYLALQLLEDRETGKGLERSRKWGKNAWANFKNVSHLWAAHIYCKRTPAGKWPVPFFKEDKETNRKATGDLGFEDMFGRREYPTGSNFTLVPFGNFPAFVGIANWFFDQATTIRPPRAKTTVLIPEECWKYPEDPNIP
jgi:hypothetical protein